MIHWALCDNVLTIACAVTNKALERHEIQLAAVRTVCRPL
jgi:hypothetical protein